MWYIYQKNYPAINSGTFAVPVAVRYNAKNILMKRGLFFTIAIIFLISCKKSAADIDVGQINSPEKWHEAYKLTINEFYDYTIAQINKNKGEVKDPTALNRKFEKKRLFYDRLLNDIDDLPLKLGYLELPYKQNEQIQLDLKRKILYDSLLFIVSPNYVAEEFLNALKNRDYDRANFVSLPDRKHYFDPLKEMDWDPRLLKIENIDCVIDNKLASCTFCCSQDTFWKEVKIRYFEGRWYNSPPKEEIGPPEE